MATLSQRFQLQPYSGKKSRFTCPQCAKSQEFTRWLDTVTGDLLPEQYGICNRSDNCGYTYSPFTREPSGQSYAQRVRQDEKHGTKPIRQPVTLSRPQRRALPLCTIPIELMEQSFKQYRDNQFAKLLQTHFGGSVADDLLRRFEVGTSTHWPGATVFWQRDELQRVRGGQVVLFDAEGHTVKITGSDGSVKRCTTWVHTAYAAACAKRNQPRPVWLTAYLDPVNQVAKSPSLYGLVQLMNQSENRPVAIVEAPKTAIVCTPYFPAFTWLAVGGLSYLNADRLRPVKQYPITLYPDASMTGSTYLKWCDKAEELSRAGFRIKVADVLEKKANVAQKVAGIDIADLLLGQWQGYPPSWNIR